MILLFGVDNPIGPEQPNQLREVLAKIEAKRMERWTKVGIT